MQSPALRAIGFAAKRRLIEVERLGHDGVLAEHTFQAIANPVAAGRQRASGLRFADARFRPLLEALILFRQLPEGFRSADLRHNLAALSARHPEAITQGAATCQLRRLRLHGPIERVPNSFRHRVTDLGLRVALFFTRACNRLLHPALAAALPGLRALATPIKRACDHIDAQLTASIGKPASPHETRHVCTCCSDASWASAPHVGMSVSAACRRVGRIAPPRRL